MVSTTNHDANFHADVTESEIAFDNWVNEAAKGASPDRVLASKDAFTTTSGLHGYKMTWKVKTTSGEDFMREQYFFRGSHDSKIQLSGICLAADASTYGPHL